MDKTALIVVDSLPPSIINQVLLNGKNSYEIVLEKVNSLGFPVFVFSKNQRPGAHSFDGDVNSLLHAIDSTVNEFEHLVFFHTEMPLLDISQSRKLIEIHHENIADYTFPEHYPDGFLPFALNRGTFVKMKMLTKGNNEPYHFKTIDKMIRFDINAYDVEIFISPVDLRFIRESFTLNDRRGLMLVQSCLEQSPDPNQLYQFFKKNPVLLKPLPAYYVVEITSDCNQNCLYCPFSVRENQREVMSPVFFAELLEQISKDQDHATIELSGFGEPLLHPEIREILKTIARFPQFKFFLETNAVLLDSLLHEIGEISNLTLIMSLDAAEPVLYKKLRGADHFEKAEANVAQFLKHYPQKGYIAITRMLDNEEQMEMFFQRWKVHKENIIINQFNDFCNCFKNRRVVELSPFNRFPCWKLQREMFISADGSVNLCSQDFSGKIPLGSLKEESIRPIIERSNQFYSSQWQEDYSGPCGQCNQWFIFNG